MLSWSLSDPQVTSNNEFSLLFPNGRNKRTISEKQQKNHIGHIRINYLRWSASILNNMNIYELDTFGLAF